MLAEIPDGFGEVFTAADLADISARTVAGPVLPTTGSDIGRRRIGAWSGIDVATMLAFDHGDGGRHPAPTTTLHPTEDVVVIV
jgi:hypothetical protein